MRYVQMKCNTATAMKLCENYIIEGDHCVDVLSACKNMTFKTDKVDLFRSWADYLEYPYIYDQCDYDAYGEYRSDDAPDNNSKSIFKLLIIILIRLFAQ